MRLAVLVLQFRQQHPCMGLPELEDAYSVSAVPLLLCVLCLLFKIIVQYVVLQIQT